MALPLFKMLILGLMLFNFLTNDGRFGPSVDQIKSFQMEKKRNVLWEKKFSILISKEICKFSCDKETNSWHDLIIHF